MRSRVRTHRSGKGRMRRIVQGTHRPRYASSKVREDQKGCIVRGTHRPRGISSRGTSSKGHIVQGTHCPSSKGRIVQGTENPRLFARGHIGRGNFFITFFFFFSSHDAAWWHPGPAVAAAQETLQFLLHRGQQQARAQQVLHRAGRVGKNPGFKKNQPSGFLVLFGFLCFFLVFIYSVFA